MKALLQYKDSDYHRPVHAELEQLSRRRFGLKRPSKILLGTARFQDGSHQIRERIAVQHLSAKAPTRG